MGWAGGDGLSGSGGFDGSSGGRSSGGFDGRSAATSYLQLKVSPGLWLLELLTPGVELQAKSPPHLSYICHTPFASMSPASFVPPPSLPSTFTSRSSRSSWSLP